MRRHRQHRSDGGQCRERPGHGRAELAGGRADAHDQQGGECHAKRQLPKGDEDRRGRLVPGRKGPERDGERARGGHESSEKARLHPPGQGAQDGSRQPREQQTRPPSQVAGRARVGEHEAAHGEQPEQRRGGRVSRERRPVPLGRDQQHRTDDQRKGAQHPADHVTPPTGHDRRHRDQRRAEAGGQEQVKHADPSCVRVPACG